MTREQFIDAWRHELAGFVLDGATANRTGADLGLFARTIMQKIDQRLGRMYDQLNPPKETPNARQAQTDAGRRP